MTNPCEGWYSSQRILLLVGAFRGGGRASLWRARPRSFGYFRWGLLEGFAAAFRFRSAMCELVRTLEWFRRSSVTLSAVTAADVSCFPVTRLRPFSWAGLGCGSSVCVQSRPWACGANGRTLPLALFYTARTSSVLPSARIAPEIPSILDV